MVRSPLRKAAFFFTATACFAAVGSRFILPGGSYSAVELAIKNEMERQHIPGLSVAIVTDDRLRWSNGYGMASLENSVPATAQTVYRLASVSKPITAVAVLQLAEQHQLDLDAPVQRYVPSFPEKPHPITSRQLLAHLGGIRGYRGDELNSTRHYKSVSEALAIFQDDPLAFEPETRFSYSTYGFNLLGSVIEGASGMSYLDFVNTHIFQPARMNTIQPDDHFAIIPHRAHGYARTETGVLVRSGMADTSNKIPGGGFCASVDDLARFAIALHSGALLKAQTLNQMYTVQRTRSGHPVAYGLGWRIGQHDGQKEVWHNGRQQRVSTILYMLPDRGFAVALMSNLEGAELLPLARTIADIMYQRR